MKTLGLAIVIACLAQAAPVVWQDPAALAREDTGAPAPPFQFEKEETGGTSPKMVVRDSKGVRWFVKFGFEAHPETFAARIVRASGYFAPITYFVPEGTIVGVPSQGLKRVGKVLEGGGRFRDARFAREMQLVDGAKWNLDESSLKGSKELSGLKLLVMLTANWDVKPPNFAVVRAAGQEMFAITDWGQTFGAPDLKTHWNCRQYRDQNGMWTHGVENGYVYLQYDGKVSDQITNGIRVEHARWLLGVLRALTPARVQEMLRASGASADEAACFGAAFVERIGTLRATLTDTQ